jgi:hypothetical protein
VRVVLILLRFIKIQELAEVQRDYHSRCVTISHNTLLEPLWI